MIKITDKAKHKISALRLDEGFSDNHNVRVAVKGGGCSAPTLSCTFYRHHHRHTSGGNAFYHIISAYVHSQAPLGCSMDLNIAKNHQNQPDLTRF